jgi:hypothetical protein
MKNVLFFIMVVIVPEGCKDKNAGLTKTSVSNIDTTDLCYMVDYVGRPYFGSTGPAECDSIDFNIKARYLYQCNWEVVFTNNNFKTEELFMDAFDVSMDGFGNDVVHQLRIFDNRVKAVTFARKFTSYQQCRNFNDSIERKYQRLLEYRKWHPAKEHDDSATGECNDEIGQEVIIYK